MRLCKIIIFLLLFFSPIFLEAQDWDYAIRTNDSINEPTLGLLNHDKYNNIYLKGLYQDTIYLQDTAFFHPDLYHVNCKVLAKYSAHGQFLQAIDFYSIQQGNVFYFDACSGFDDNTFVAGSFVDRIFFMDTVVVHGSTPIIESPEVFLTKINDKNEVLWADVIGGTLQDDLLDIESDNNENIIICTNHLNSMHTETQNYFLSQDTSYHTWPFIAITKIDSEKNILWKQELEGHIHGELIVNNNNEIYFIGNCWTNLIYNGDTIYNPDIENLPYSSMPFIMQIKSNGSIDTIAFIDNEIYYQDYTVNDNGDIFFTAYIEDTTYINNDTIVVPPNNRFQILTKYNADLSFDWYRLFTKNISGVSFSSANLKAKEDNILITISATNDFLYHDSLITSPTNNRIFLSEINPDGELVFYKTIGSTGSSNCFNNIVIDNCEDIIINGTNGSRLYFDNDTVQALNGSGYFIAKLQMHEPVKDFLPNDTIVCDSFSVIAPIEYFNYLWNDSLTVSNIFQIYESSEVRLAMGDENNCWHYDTIQVQIDEPFNLDLETDTTIFGNDTIYISVEDNLDRYLWSNGDTINQIQIIGNNYGLGEFPIWIEAMRGTCIETDTIVLTVEGGFGIEQLSDDSFSLYPNPTNDFVTNESSSEQFIGYSYEIIDLSGHILRKGKIKDAKQIISVEDLKSGIYLFRIYNDFNKITYRTKLIIQ